MPNGKLEIFDSAGTKRRILLDGDTGDLTAGGKGVAGEVLLQDSAGNTTLTARGADGSRAGIWIGGGGEKTGDLYLNNKKGRFTIALRAVEEDVAGAWIGGNGQVGWIVLRNAKDFDTVALGGETGLLELRDANGTTMIQLNGSTGAGRFGGRGVNGDVLVFAKNAPNTDSDQATVWVRGDTGDVVLRNADAAEEFEVRDAREISPGAVVALAGEGALRLADRAYDRTVAGIISGAGSLRPGIVLGRVPGGRNRWPVALSGTVYCQADASYGPIEVGDLLTTSETAGHAMSAREPARAFGAVLGKAMGRLDEGRGLVPVLVSLQ